MQNNVNIHDYDLMHQFVSPDNLVGEEDASVEWEEPESSAELFINTETYNDFKKENCLYLFGRRGTGKTAFIKKLNYEIKNGENQIYCASWIIDQEDAYIELATQLRGSPFISHPSNEIINFLIKKWIWVIQVSAMLSVVTTFGNNSSRLDELKLIKKYLEEQNLLQSRTGSVAVSRLCDILINCLLDIDYAPAKIGAAIAKMSRELKNIEFENALFATSKILKRENKKSLIFIDSIEQYDLNDSINECIVISLVEAVRRCHKIRNKTNILAKAAFPSEIYSQIRVLNPGKVEGKNLFILWRYKDLVCLMAKRFYRYLYDEKSADRIADFSNYNIAKAFIYEHLSPTVNAVQGLEFDTLAYIIRHTQKKPRQAITILNIILTCAQNSPIDVRNIPSEFIPIGVHARLDILIKETLSVYEQVYNNCEKIVSAILTKAPCSFHVFELDKLLKEISSLRAESCLSNEEVKRMLIECGVVGTERTVHTFNGKSVVEGLFEYQIKGVLSLSNRTNLVVHPMCYEHCQINLNHDRFVYPMPYENEEILMLKEIGIQIRG